MIVRLKDVVKINAATLPEGTPADLSFRYVDISSVNSAGVITLPEKPVAFADAPSRARRLAAPGATIVSTVRTYLRAIAQVPDEPGLVFSTGFAALEPTAVIDPDYLFFFCRSDAFIDNVRARSVGVSYPAINAADIGAFRLDLPPLEEQRRIAARLRAELRRVEQAEVAVDDMRGLLDERREAIALRCLLASDDATPSAAAGDFLGEVPVTWSTGRLKDVAARVDVGIAEAATHAYVDTGVPLIRSTNIRPGVLLTDDLLHITPHFALRNRAKTVHADDILTVRTGNPGVSAVVPQHLEGSQTFTQLITTLRPPHMPAYFCAWLNAQAARRYFESFAWGSAQRNISVPILANVPVPVPPAAEQAQALHRLAEALAPITAMRRELDRHTELLQERKRALITAALPAPIEFPGVAA